MMEKFANFMELGLIPDMITRWGIRYLVGNRLRDESENFKHNEVTSKQRFVAQMKKGPIALHTDEANAQHYELPPHFFETVLGYHKKYSACVWGESIKTLDEAESTSLKISCQRAQIEDGMKILELGCGWGALSLWIANQYPKCTVTAVSNSSLQRKYILDICNNSRIDNVEVITCDMNTFKTSDQFDRVISIEMFEHMRNYHLLMKHISHWLKPNGKLFFHIFCHQQFPYFFETGGKTNWMGRYFFTGGIMPSIDLPSYFQEDLSLECKWWLEGHHYEKTAEAWLRNMDKNKEKIIKIFYEVYGKPNSKRWFNRWRIFFMACAELFGYRGGAEWGVSHYLFKKKTGKVKNEN